MNKNFRYLIFTGFGAALLLSAPPAAQGQIPPFYVRADAGGALTGNTDLKEFFGENTTGARVKFDPGIRVAVAAGYHLTDWFAAEVETGVTANRIDSITGAYTDDASLANVPLLLNARLQLPTRSRFTPYIGGGPGISAAVIDANRIDFGQTSLHGTQSDVVFAYQAFAGLRYRLNDQMGLSVEYHYFATTEPTWRTDFAFGTGSDRMRFGRTETHAFTLAFDYSF